MHKWILLCDCFIIFLLSSAYSKAVMNIPWGPYIISRSGRSSPDVEWHEDTDRCCPLGLRSQVRVDEFGKLHKAVHCNDHLRCCPGLEEISSTSDEGIVYSFCEESDAELDKVVHQVEQSERRKRLSELLLGLREQLDEELYGEET